MLVSMRVFSRRNEMFFGLDVDLDLDSDSDGLKEIDKSDMYYFSG